MAEQICHKLLNENLKCFCNYDYDSLKEKDVFEEPKELFDATNGCSAKCEEMCNNIQERLRRIRDLIHLRSSTPNVILVETLIAIKQYVKEIKKYISMFNTVLSEEKNAANILEQIVDFINLQNHNVEELFHIFDKNIVVTKNNTQITLKEPQRHCAFSESLVNHLLAVQGDKNSKDDKCMDKQPVEEQEQKMNQRNDKCMEKQPVEEQEQRMNQRNKQEK